MEAESRIAEWYKGKTIFITGATGFIGKVLIEKLLRSCPDVGPIYVLVRDKKKTTPHDRVKKLMSIPAFEKVRATRRHSSSEDWIVPVPGDLVQPELGISAESRCRLQEKVSVVFHVAATVKFDERLGVATAMNVGGTRAVLELCRGMTSLVAVVHVSTAFANCTQTLVEERIYPPPTDPIVITNCVSSLNDELLEMITPRILGKHPNTYTFTKAIAEHVVAEYSAELPIVVVRPSIVWASWKEPKPGWIDNLNGPGGLALAGSKGLVKSFYLNPERIIDIVPVDICGNLLIAAAWEMGALKSTTFSPDVLVYNCVSGRSNPVTWGGMVNLFNNSFKKYSPSDFLIIPNCVGTNSKVKHILTKALLQTIPAATADFCIWLTGGKPKFRYWQRQISKLEKAYKFCSSNEWEFEVNNVEQLKHRMSPIDRKVFDLEITNINWTEYFDNSFLGLRRYVMNEKDETIEAAKKKIHQMGSGTEDRPVRGFYTHTNRCLEILWCIIVR